MSLPPIANSLLAAGPEADLALPPPHGWIGTADDWARGLGIAFVVLALAILAVSWGRLRRAGLTPGLKELLVILLVVLPPAIVFFGYSYGIERSKSIGSCGSCHVMKPYLADLQNPDSSTLAATHYKNRYIQEHHCYTCHTDYGMFGTVQAKIAGLGHVARNLSGRYSLPLKIAHPYPNSRCLACHAESQKFRKSEGHRRRTCPSCSRARPPASTATGPRIPR